jgi:2-oxoglutarate dehydrogenase E1 component
MHNNSYLFSFNAPFIEEIYEKYLNNPENVDPSWHKYFQSLSSNEEYINEISHNRSTIKSLNSSESISNANQNILDLINTYRKYGHINATLDPLGIQKSDVYSYIDIYNTGTNLQDKCTQIDITDKCFFSKPVITLNELSDLLKKTYSSNIGFEIEHLENIEEKTWFYKEIESNAEKIDKIFTSYDKKAFLSILLQATVFEQYLHTKFVGAKRFSIEGGESAIAALQEIIRLSAANSIDEIVIGMAHRGRLNTLVNVLHKPHSQIFAGFMGYTSHSDLPSFLGDVKYHLGYSNDIEVDEKNIHLSLTPNPSHLESVNCVVMGRVKAKQDLYDDIAREKVMGLLIHGDASVAGQGSVMEALSMSKINAYDTGGVMHIVINNQIGFTTNPSNDRSTRYCSDIAKGLDMPIIHVNGGNIEAVIYAVRLAMAYKVRFKKDIFIDIVCYRKYGHNEGDEPVFTQPLMYQKIQSSDFKDITTSYVEHLIQNGDITQEEFDEISQAYIAHMDAEYEIAKKLTSGEVSTAEHHITSIWTTHYTKHLMLENKIYAAHNDNATDVGCASLGNVDVATLQNVVTGVDAKILKSLGMQLTNVPSNFSLNGKIARQFETRKQMMESGTGIDWGTGEALAFASLIADGINIRFTGQDVERGTFSHRHAVLTDQQNGNIYISLNNIQNPNSNINPGKIHVSNSNLSEFGVLAYEYGYAMSNPNCLTIWEAQFGDFANGAQVIIDQYISAAESKWGMLNNLVMLLPHGYEGQGPEHSSARLERFLQMCAQNNIQVCNCTTPASLFHVLRRQVLQDLCKPLIIMTPKSLLRHKFAISNIEEMSSNMKFQPVISKSNNDTNSSFEKIIFCSGKIYYDLLEYREKKSLAQNITLIRIEQLYPFPIAEVKEIIASNKNAKIIWCQEEPQNMGAYSFVKPILEDAMLTIGHSLNKVGYAGRYSTATTATGFTKLHQSEVEKYLHDAISC